MKLNLKLKLELEPELSFFWFPNCLRVCLTSGCTNTRFLLSVNTYPASCLGEPLKALVCSEFASCLNSIPAYSDAFFFALFCRSTPSLGGDLKPGTLLFWSIVGEIRILLTIDTSSDFIARVRLTCSSLLKSSPGLPTAACC